MQRVTVVLLVAVASTVIVNTQIPLGQATATAPLVMGIPPGRMNLVIQMGHILQGSLFINYIYISILD
jgi:hypothetical protein